MTDPIADMLTRIRNAILAKQGEVRIPFSKIKFEIAKILEREGFISSLERITPDSEQGHQGGASLKITLKYKKGESAIRGLKRLSRPGRRTFRGYGEIPRLLPSLGIIIVSTSRGLMTNTEAKQQKVGGELLCEVY